MEKWAAQKKYRKTKKGQQAHKRATENLLQKNPGYFRWRHLLIAYNITREQVYKQLEEQNWICPVCKKPLTVEAEGGDSIAVDHDHSCCNERKTCGICIRGILHRECNAGIGKLRDNPDILRNAIEYLEKWKKG